MPRRHPGDIPVLLPCCALNLLPLSYLQASLDLCCFTFRILGCVLTSKTILLRALILSSQGLQDGLVLQDVFVTGS